ncbi:glycosyl hydrolase family 31 [Spirochaetia bacterium]|nr:glycosyl hydrolase family 31 [Spirochaetia bacterium]
MSTALCEGVWRCTFGAAENASPVRFFGKYDAAALEDGGALLPFKHEHITWRLTQRGCVIELPMKNDEDFYGFGLQFHSINHRGRRRFMKVNSDPVTDTGESHAPVPFYVSSAGYGVLVDTFRYVTFFLGTNGAKGSSKNIAKPVKVHEEFSEQALYALKQARNERRVLIETPNCKGVDLYFFEGPSMLDAVRRYNLFSGGGCLPPLWGLGNWYRAYGGSDQQHVLKMAEDFRRDSIPVDVIGLEPGWHSHSYSCTYAWNKSLFPEPDALLGTLKQQNYHVNLWEHVFVHPLSELYGQLESSAGDYEVWGGLVPDLADKKAGDIFSEFHGKNFIDHGVSGFKADECDNSDFNKSNWSFPDLSSFPSGLDGEQMHSALGMLYQRTIEKAFRDRGLRTLGQVRSSWALAAGSPFVLYSDLYDHRQFIRALVNSGFSGLLWSPEVRSCKDTEDFIRRLQSVVFSPQSLLNCWRIPNPPWYQVDIEKNLAGERMDESGEITAIAASLLKLRMKLLPYLYTAFRRYHTEGLPPVRALVLDYPKDGRTHSIDDQYILGDSLLVAPVFWGQNSRTVFLPEGDWYDFWTHEKINGGRAISYDAPLDRIPVFIKSGSILPLAEPVQYVDAETLFSMTIFCFGVGGKNFTLYEDDGTSLAYEEGKYNTVVLSAGASGGNSGKGAVSRTGTEKPRYNIREWKYIV